MIGEIARVSETFVDCLRCSARDLDGGSESPAVTVEQGTMQTDANSGHAVARFRQVGPVKNHSDDDVQGAAGEQSHGFQGRFPKEVRSDWEG